MTRWQLFREIIKTRYNLPKGHPEFYMYFFLINIVFGGLGVYVSVFIDCRDGNEIFDYRALNTNIATYYIAILASACFDLFLSKAKIMKNTMSIFAITVLVLGIGALLISHISRLRYAIPLTLIFTIISLLMWRIANADNDKLMNDEVPPNVTTGGDITQAIVGDLSGLRS